MPVVSIPPDHRGLCQGATLDHLVRSLPKTGYNRCGELPTKVKRSVYSRTDAAKVSGYRVVVMSRLWKQPLTPPINPMGRYIFIVHSSGILWLSALAQRLQIRKQASSIACDAVWKGQQRPQPTISQHRLNSAPNRERMNHPY